MNLFASQDDFMSEYCRRLRERATCTLCVEENIPLKGPIWFTRAGSLNDLW